MIKSTKIKQSYRDNYFPQAAGVFILVFVGFSLFFPVLLF